MTDDQVQLDDGLSPAVVRLAGAIDGHGAEALHRVALGLAARTDDVVVACERARHVGAAALQVLLAWHVALARQGRGLVIRHPSPAIARVVMWVGLRQE